MSTRGFYNTDKHTCETHTRTHPDFASSCRWDLVRQVFTPVISHHLARHCLWQPHQPHNEDTWGKRRHRLSIKLLRREATAKWDIIMDIMEMFKHQGSLILYIYIYYKNEEHVYWCVVLNPCFIMWQRQSLKSAVWCRQTGFTSRLMMIAFINNVSV